MSTLPEGNPALEITYQSNPPSNHQQSDFFEGLNPHQPANPTIPIIDTPEPEDHEYDFYCPPAPTREEMIHDHKSILRTISQEPLPTTANNYNSPESQERLATTIAQLLQDSSDIEGIGPNREKITIRRGLITFAEITVSKDLGSHTFEPYNRSHLSRHLSPCEIVTKFQVNEEGVITSTSAFFTSTHYSIHSSKSFTITSPIPTSLDLQHLLDTLQITKQGEPVSKVQRFLRKAVVTAIELAPLTDGYYDKLRRKMPPHPPKNPRIRDSLH